MLISGVDRCIDLNAMQRTTIAQENRHSYFFFSSRRRHTRFDCDWSSDVCSSDLVGVGDRLPDMPLYLTNALYIYVPLEPTYQAAWDASPEELRLAVETGVMPEADRKSVV